jgi:hypothetical protein
MLNAQRRPGGAGAAVVSGNEIAALDSPAGVGAQPLRLEPGFARIDERSERAHLRQWAALIAEARSLRRGGHMTAASPLRGREARLAALRAVLKPLDPRLLTTAEIIRICEDAVPDAAGHEIAMVLVEAGDPRSFADECDR